jgi:hypothetical protein
MGEIRYQQKPYSQATDYLRKQAVICSEFGVSPGPDPKHRPSGARAGGYTAAHCTGDIV